VKREPIGLRRTIGDGFSLRLGPIHYRVTAAPPRHIRPFAMRHPRKRIAGRRARLSKRLHTLTAGGQWECGEIESLLGAEKGTGTFCSDDSAKRASPRRFGDRLLA
jgi:hypothetical protein